MNYFAKALLAPAASLLVQAPFSFPSAFLLNLARCTAATLAIQTAVAVPSVLLQAELFYDLSGAACFVVATGLSLVYPSLQGWERWVDWWVSSSAGGDGVGGWWQWKEFGLGLLDAWPVDWRQLLVSAVVCVWACRCESSSLSLSLSFLLPVLFGLRYCCGVC